MFIVATLKADQLLNLLFSIKDYEKEWVIVFLFFLCMFLIFLLWHVDRKATKEIKQAGEYHSIIANSIVVLVDMRTKAHVAYATNKWIVEKALEKGSLAGHALDKDAIYGIYQSPINVKDIADITGPLETYSYSVSPIDRIGKFTPVQMKHRKH